MKRTFSFFLITIVTAAAVIAVYRFAFRKSIPDAPVDNQVVSILQQNDCFVCHSPEPKLPFYATFPVVSKMMGQHVRHAQSFVDLQNSAYNASDISEVTLSMIEHSVMYNTMPIGEYRLIHWGTGFNSKEKTILTKWIRDIRLEKFSNGLACEEFATEGVQPIPSSVPFDEQKAQLGRRMYFDGRLSADGSISCASCHLLEQGGADEDSERTSEGINGQFGGVNAPTVYNSVFNIRQFWNGRAADLQEQAAGPPVNPVEMGAHTWDDIVAKLKEDKELVKEFKTLYPEEGLTKATVTGAIAEFEKTLLTPDSRFDLYLKGDKNAMTEQEIRGYEVFKKNGCATCHTGVILGGKSFEQLCIFGDYFAERDDDIAYNSDDDGLMGFTGKGIDLHKFKVPGLRNVYLTAPYFHDGSCDDLDDAIEEMAKFILGKDLKDADEDAIEAFLKTLTGKNENLKNQ